MRHFADLIRHEIRPYRNRPHCAHGHQRDGYVVISRIYGEVLIHHACQLCDIRHVTAGLLDARDILMRRKLRHHLRGYADPCSGRHIVDVYRNADVVCDFIKMLHHARPVRLVVIRSYYKQGVCPHFFITDTLFQRFFRAVRSAVCYYRYPSAAFIHGGPYDFILLFFGKSRCFARRPQHQDCVGSLIDMPVYQLSQPSVIDVSFFIERRYQSCYRSSYHFCLPKNFNLIYLWLRVYNMHSNEIWLTIGILS